MNDEWGRTIMTIFAGLGAKTFNYLIDDSSEDKKQSILMILKLLLNTQIIWMIFIKTLKNTTQIKNIKY